MMDQWPSKGLGQTDMGIGNQKYSICDGENVLSLVLMDGMEIEWLVIGNLNNL